MESTKGFFDRFPFPIPWIVSAALALGAGAIILLPSVVEMTRFVIRGSQPPPTSFYAVWEAIWLVVLVFITGYILEALSTSMYEILEGYRLWPKWLSDLRRQHHLEKRNELERRHKAYEVGDSSEKFDVVLIEQRLSEYPVGDEDIAPTRLGNAIKAMETYGTNHFELDSQLLWYELTTTASAPLRLELITSRQGADFFVGTVFTSTLFGMAALLTGVFEDLTGFSGKPGIRSFAVGGPTGEAHLGPVHLGLDPVRIGLGDAHILLGVVVLMLVPFFCYRMAIGAARPWAGALQALVNLGRIRLAGELQLSLPAAYEEEKKLWEALCGFIQRRSPDEIARWARRVYVARERTRSTRSGRGRNVSRDHGQS